MRIPKLPDSLKVARVYLRVSTDEQDLQRQEAITGQAKAAGYYVAGIYREKASGARPDRPELLRMVADLQPGELVWTGGDVHLYNNHLAQAETQLAREPYPLPTLELRHAPSIDAYQYSDITLQNYQSHPAIPAPVAV